MITTTVKYRKAGSDTDTIISVDSGISTRMTLDNTLNNGQFVMSRTTDQETYDRFDKIIVEYSDGISDDVIEGFLIYDDISTIEAKGDKKRWRHELTLIEPTKIHERYLISSKAFSRNKDGSAIYNMYQTLVILQEIAFFEKYDLFLAKDKIYNIPSSVQTILERYDTPQLFFLEPTLRESINGLFSFIDATYEIDVDRNIILRFYNEVKGEITEIGVFDDEMRIANGDYYQTELDVIAVNVVNDKVALPSGTPSVVNRHTINNFANLNTSQNPLTSIRVSKGTFGSSFSTTGGDLPLPVLTNYGDSYICITDYYSVVAGRDFDANEVTVYDANGNWTSVTSPFSINSSVGSYFRSDDVVLGDSNQVIQLTENLALYEIEDVFISVRPDLEVSPYSAVITDFVKTEAQYAKLDDATSTPVIPNKENSVIYDITGSQIKDFGREWGVLGLNRTIDNMIRTLINQGELGGSTGALGIQTPPYDNDKILITVTYRPIVPKMRITAARTNVNKVNVFSAIRENQDENMVSMQNYGNNLLAKSNRLGNEELLYTQTVTKLSNLYHRGYITPNGEIVTNVEKVSYPEFLKVKYTTVKDFNKFSEFIGLAGRRRQYELKAETTVDRLLNYTEYLQVLPGVETYENDTAFSDFAITRIIESLIFNYGDNCVRGVIIDSDEITLTDYNFENYGITNTWLPSTSVLWAFADIAGTAETLSLQSGEPFPIPTTYSNGTQVKVTQSGEITYWATYSVNDIAIYLPVFKTGSNKSLLFNFSFKDTLSAGNRVRLKSGVDTKIAVPYTDDNGQLRKVTFKFINYINPSWSIGTGIDFDKYSNDAKDAPNIILTNANLGGRKVTYIEGEYLIDKDVAEKISFTQQLQFLGYEDQIIVGNEWARLCQLILDLPGPALYLYTSNDQYGLLEDKKIKTDATKVGTIVDYSSFSTTYKRISLNTAGIAATVNSVAWAIGDNDKNLWIAVNQSGDSSSNITQLSFKAYNKRPEIVYNI